MFPPLVSESPTPHRSLAKGQSLGREVVRGRRHPDLSCDQHHVAGVVLSKHSIFPTEFTRGILQWQKRFHSSFRCVEHMDLLWDGKERTDF